MLLIDKVIWGFLAIFFLMGWSRGFLKSLIGPVAFILCFLSAIIFYDVNKNILMTAVIIFAGTIFLELGLSLLLILVMGTVQKEYRGKVFLFSRILGATISIAWQSNILFLAILLYSITPVKEGLLTDLKRQLPQSTLINQYKAKVVNTNNHYQALVATLEMLGKPDKYGEISKNPHFIAFQEDPKFQAFIHDPDLVTAFQQKDYVTILKAPSLRDLVTNDNSMHIFTKIAEDVYLDKLDLFSDTANRKVIP